MTVWHLELNNWLLTERETAVAAFSNHHIRIGFEEGDSGAWLAMKHRDSGFSLRRFVDTPEDARAAFDEAADMMPAYLATVERINATYPDTKAVPFYSQADSVQCADWTIDNLQPNNPWAERSAVELNAYETSFRTSALGVLERACVYQDFLNAVQDKASVNQFVSDSTAVYAQGQEARCHSLQSVQNDIHGAAWKGYLDADPYLQIPVENKVFFNVQYAEDGKAIEVHALAMTFDGGNPQHYQVEAGAQATIQDDGQIFLANRASDEYMVWSLTEQELGLHDGNLSVMQFAGVPAFDTLTCNHAYQSSASADFLASIDGDVFTQEEQSYGRDSGMGL